MVVRNLWRHIFEYASGLTVNADQSKATWIGSKCGSHEIIYPHIKLDWTTRKFKVLGITYVEDLENISELN